MPAATPVGAIQAGLGDRLVEDRIDIPYFNFDVGMTNENESCTNNVLRFTNYTQGSCMRLADWAELGGGVLPSILDNINANLYITITAYTHGLTFSLSENPDCSPSSTFLGAPAVYPTNYPVGRSGCQKVWFSANTAAANSMTMHLPIFLSLDAPTDVPTAVPTNVPTDIPTALPTYVPTPEPAPVPTPAPTSPLGPVIVFPADLDKHSSARTIGDNVRRTWEVACDDADSVVFLTRAYFDTERNFDFVRIYNESGDKLVWSGNLSRDQFTFGSNITIEFTSDRSVSSKGFELHWTCQPSVIVFPADLDKHSSARTIGDNVRRTWEFACDSDSVFLTRAYFDTERNFDFVRIYSESGDKLVWSGNLSVGYFTFVSNITIEFTSDRSVSSKGFEIHLMCQPAPAPTRTLSLDF